MVIPGRQIQSQPAIMKRKDDRVKEIGRSMQGNIKNQKGGMVRLLLRFSSLRSLLFLFLSRFCRDLLFDIRGSVIRFDNFWQEERSSASCGLCNNWHLCRVVGFRQTSLRLSTIRRRRPCRPSRSVRSTARGEQCAFARIWCRGRESWLEFGLHPDHPHPLPRHCLRLRKERS